MLGSVVLDLAIGMAFVYLLLSLIASAVQEIISSFLQVRAANLQRGIRSLLSEDSIDGSVETLAESVYKHGLVRGLYQDLRYDYQTETDRFDRFRIWLQKVFGIAPPRPIQGIENPLLLPSYIPSRTFALAVIDLLNQSRIPGDADSNVVADVDPLARIKRVLEASQRKSAEGRAKALARDPTLEVRENKAVEALLALANQAGSADGSGIEAFQGGLQDWYDDAMDRVSGWYKKYTQKVLLGIGLVLATALNVDSVHLARTLWLNRDIRQSMVDVAKDYGSRGPAQDAHHSGGCISAEGEAAIGEMGLAEQMRCRADAFQAVSDTVLLPVGWLGTRGPVWARGLSGAQRGLANLKIAAAWVFPWIISLHGAASITGWLITAVAISLGAPFWFDTLNRFMVVRSTIKPQEKSRNEKSKS